MTTTSKSIKKEYPNAIEWVNEQGQFHREDGPAREWINRDKEWWLNGKIHRLDGPASVLAGAKFWFVNDCYVYIY